MKLHWNYRILIAFILSIVLTPSLAQEAGEEIEDSSLSGQFETLKKRSNNYQIYEVIARDNLEEFWSNIQDTLKETRQTASQTRVDLNQARSNINRLNSRIDSLQSSLEDTQYMVDRVSFMGMAMKKQTYNVMVWVIIAVLAVLAIFIQYRYNRANKVTSQARKELSELQDEFETHRKKTRERETTLKRDLQTQINKVEELEKMIENMK